MIRSIVVTGLSAALFASSAAAASPIARAFGNTIVSTYPDGRQAELWLQPGGAYSAQGRRGDRSSGHWRLNGGKLCLSQSRPLPVPFSYCTAVPARSPAATWSAKAVTGEAIKVKVVKGRYSGHG